MARRAACVGRPRKHSGGWESANSRIYLRKETLAEWRRLRRNLDFTSDDDVAVFLLHRNKVLNEMVAPTNTSNGR